MGMHDDMWNDPRPRHVPPPWVALVLSGAVVAGLAVVVIAWVVGLFT